MKKKILIHVVMLVLIILFISLAFLSDFAVIDPKFLSGIMTVIQVLGIIFIGFLLLLFAIGRYSAPINNIMKMKDPKARIEAIKAHHKSGKRPRMRHYHNALSLAYYEMGDTDQAIYYNEREYRELLMRKKLTDLALMSIHNNRCNFYKYAGYYQEMKKSLAELELIYNKKTRHPNCNHEVIYDTIISTKLSAALSDEDIGAAEAWFSEYKITKHHGMESELVIELYEAELLLLKKEPTAAAAKVEHVLTTAQYPILRNKAYQLQERLKR